MFVGDSAVGKTSFLRRLCEARFSPGMAATVGEFSQGGNEGLMGGTVALTAQQSTRRSKKEPISPDTAELLSSWCMGGVGWEGKEEWVHIRELRLAKVSLRSLES